MDNTADGRISCPFCSEKISSNAKKCRFCGEWLGQNNSTTGIKTSKLDHKHHSTQKIFLAVIFILLILFSFKFLSQFWSNLRFQQTITTQPDERSLRQLVNEQYRLLNSKNKDDLARLYRDFYSPEHSIKKQTEEDFIKADLDRYNNGLDHTLYEVHSVRVEGLKGYVDRTQTSCGDTTCSKVLSQDRSIRLYVWFQNKWLMTDEQILCSRENPYTNPPEFDRVYSLIIQRTSNFKTDYESIKNCVLFRYADSDSEMNNAEGQFSFISGQSTDKLEILVSPRYKIKDDLITAILVVHELQHALDYVYSLSQGKKVDCYQTEANAFQNQVWFMSILNPEERSSINARLATGGSEELRSIKYTWDGVANARGETSEEKAMNFVRSIPAYQKLCSK
jgi:hypothetical protein